MSKTKVLVTKINGYILIAFGLMYIFALGFYFCALIPFNRIFSDATPTNVKHVIITHMILTSLIGMLFVVSFIASGIGVLRFREWARKVSIGTLLLHLLILAPVVRVQVKIEPMIILYVFISIAVICLLSKRYVKDLFNKNGITCDNSL
jgi:hypothetical protein